MASITAAYAGWHVLVVFALINQLNSSLPTPEQDGTMAFSMFIKWTASDEPFPAPGDSGSLVYTFFDNSIVPLGILYGSDGDESYACLLYSWFTEIEATPTAMHICDSRMNSIIS